MKPLYSLPTLFTAQGSIKKPWHVEFFYTNSETGTAQRFRIRNSAAYPSGINRLKIYKDRYSALIALQKEITVKLQSGWNPFGHTDTIRNHITIEYALTMVLAVKKGYLMETSYKPFEYRINLFIQWLYAYQRQSLHPSQIKTIDIIEFLNYLTVTKSHSPRTRNNFLIDISSCFAYMDTIDPNWCPINPCDKANRLPNRSNQHEVWKPQKLASLSKYLKENDPNLYAFCITFMLLGIRPLEAVKIQIDQINLIDKTFVQRASNDKTADRKVKRIFKNLLAVLETLNLENYPGNYYLFTTKGKPGVIPTTRDYFTRQFAKAKKELKYTKYNSMYALKHTFIIELVKSGEPLNNIMKITGHKTLSAFQCYVQQYLDEPSEELNDNIHINF